jgi:FkbM family methyltransferase
MKEFYSEFLSAGDYVMDVGANRGRYTQLFLSIGATVLSVEPHPECLNSLHQIKSASLTILPVAVSDQIGNQTFMLCNEDEVSTLSTEFKEEYGKQDFLNWNTEISVKTTTLDAIIEEHNLPTYLKIDIEGYEHLALSKLSHPVPFISFEFTYPFRHHAITCINHIDATGDYQYNYYAFEHFEFELDSWVSSEHMIDILQKLDSKILVGDIYARKRT